MIKIESIKDTSFVAVLHLVKLSQTFDSSDVENKAALVLLNAALHLQGKMLSSEESVIRLESVLRAISQ